VTRGAKRWLLDERARGPSRAAGGDAWSHLEDLDCADLAAEELRRGPEPGLNSIACLLWRLARAEDVARSTPCCAARSSFERL
jgi:hypothetical protein